MNPALQTLEALARERSSDKRRALLRSITDCFFVAPDRHSETELDLFDDVMEMVLTEVEPVARAELAERLADIANPPRRVVGRLAGDDIAVARPILMRSSALTDDDLEDLARRMPQTHLAAIAERSVLSERITDVLVHRGDEIVLDRVVANRGARFSEQGFTTLADKAEHNDGLLGRLASRGDLPEQVVNRIVPLITASMQAKLAAAGADVDGDVVDGLIEESRLTLVNRLRATASTARPLELLLDLVDRGVITLDEAVTEIADADGALQVSRLIAGRIDLRPDTVMRALYAASEEPVTVVCRGAGIYLNGFSAVLRMRRRRRRGGDSNPAAALNAFLQLPPETAERVIRFLRVRETAEHLS